MSDSSSKILELKVERELLLRYVINDLKSKNILEGIPSDGLSTPLLESVSVSSLLNLASEGKKFNFKTVITPPPKPSLPPPLPNRMSISKSPEIDEFAPQNLNIASLKLSGENRRHSSAPLSPSGDRAAAPPVPKRPAKTTREIIEDGGSFNQIHSHLHTAFLIQSPKEDLFRISPEWSIDDEQKKFAAFESLLLCTTDPNLTPKELETIDYIRTFLGITMKLNKFLKNSLQISPSSSLEFTTSLNYRFHLLKSTARKDFGVNLIALRAISEEILDTDLKTFKNRQAFVLFEGLVSLLLHSQWKLNQIETLDGRTVSSHEYLDEIKTLLEEFITIPFEDESFGGKAENLEKQVEHLSKLLKLPSKFLPYSFSINCQLYEQLLASYFDDEEGKMHSKSVVENITSVLVHYRTKYFISDYQWELGKTKAYFKQYIRRQERFELLEVLENRVEAMVNLDRNLDANDRNYALRFAEEFYNWLAERLNNYREFCTRSPVQLTKYFKIFKDLITIKLKGKNLDKNPQEFSKDLEERIIEEKKELETKSGNSFYLKHTSPLKPWNYEDFKKFSVDLLQHIKDEKKFFLPQLTVSTTENKSYFIVEMARLFSNDVYEILSKVNSLDKDIALLQGVIVKVCKTFADEGVDQKLLPDLTLLYSPLVTNFIQDQELILSTFVKRAIDAEAWKPIDENQMYSTSVLDVFEMFAQTTPFMFSLAVPELSEFFVGTMLSSISRTLSSYVHQVTEICSHRNALIPPSGGVRLKGKRQSQIAGMVGKKHEPPLFLDPNFIIKLSSQKVEQLLVRLNNLDCAKKQLESYKNILKEKASKQGLPNDSAYWDGRFASTINSIDKGMEEMKKYIGTKIVFFHFRNNLLETLYVPAVKYSNFKLDEFLPNVLDPLLEGICSNTSDALSKDIIFWIFRMMLEAMHYVLLYGGNGRVYECTDSSQVMHDIKLLEDFFMAKDSNGIPQGLSQEEVESESKYLSGIVADVFDSSTEMLIAKYSLAKEMGAIVSKQHILAVLMHRNDSEARNFMKNLRTNPLYKSVKRGSNVLADLEAYRK